jgi:hypothetical protein
MPLGYDSKAVILKTGDDEYKLCWNVGNVILSVLTEDQIYEMIDRLTELVTLPPGQRGVYHFPVMRHYPPDSAGDLISRIIIERARRKGREWRQATQ